METFADFVVVGGGIAGLRAAVALAPAGRVLILTKGDPGESNTGYAQGGIAAAVGSDDSPRLHATDTVRAGDGLCDEPVVTILVREGPRYIQELISWGARFDRDAAGDLELGLEAAHGVRRVLHAGDATGREIARALWERVVALPSVTIVNHVLVTDLIQTSGRVRGVRFFDAVGQRVVVEAAATLLATGGAGHVYQETTNPAVATGDGVALAWQAGASVADLEFVQFHPTALNLPGAPRFLISEALRGEGARLVNQRGEAFMTRYHPDGDLAPRDVVARAIVKETERAGPVSLTLAHLANRRIEARFPMIADMCRQLGLNLASDPIPVGPAAHYLMGGVLTDEWGRTSLSGLFAAGETACTGVHGANRLASNSLLEGLVFGARAGTAMVSGPTPASGTMRAGWRLMDDTPRPPPVADSTSGDVPTDEVRQLMWRDVGLFRRRFGLEAAVARLEGAWARLHQQMTTESPGEARWWRGFNLITVARLIARAALRREESRGAHFRDDFPARDDGRWRFHAVERIGHDREP